MSADSRRRAQDAARRHARRLAESHYRRNRAFLADVPEELFQAMLHESIPGGCDERAAYAGARALIERLKSAAARSRATYHAALEQERRRQVALAELRARLADLALRVRSGGDVVALAAEAADLRRQLEAMTDPLASAPPAVRDQRPDDRDDQIMQLYRIGVMEGIDLDTIEAKVNELRAEWRE